MTMKAKVILCKQGKSKNLICKNYIVKFSENEIYDVKCYKMIDRASTAYKIKALAECEAAKILRESKGETETDKDTAANLIEKIERWNSKRGFKRKAESRNSSQHHKRAISVKPLAVSPVEQTIKVQAPTATEPVTAPVSLTAEQIRENTAEGLIKAFALIINADGSFSDDEIAEFSRMCSLMPYLKAFEYESVMELLNGYLDLLNASNADAEFIDGFINSVKDLLPRDSEVMRRLVRGIFCLIKADGVESSQEIEMAMKIIKTVDVPIEDVFLEGLSNCKKESQVEDDSEQNSDEVLLKDEEADSGAIKILSEENKEPARSEGSEKPDGIIRIIKHQTIKMKIENPQ